MAKGKPAALKGKADNDKLNNEKDPNKRIKLILDKKKDEFKMPNSCLDAWLKKYKDGEKAAEKIYIEKNNWKMVFESLVKNPELTSSDLTTSFVAALDGIDSVVEGIINKSVFFSDDAENLVILCNKLNDNNYEERTYRKRVEDERFRLGILQSEIRGVRDNLYAMESSKDGLVDLKDVLLKIDKKIEKDRKVKAIKQTKVWKVEREARDNKRVEKAELAQEIAIKEELEHKEAKREMELKSRREINDYFENMKKKHETQLSKMKSKAEEKASKLAEQYKNRREADAAAEREALAEASRISQKEKSQSQQISTRKGAPLYHYKHKNHSKDYKRWIKEQLESLKKNYPKIDYEELRKHQKNIEDMIKKRKLENSIKLKESLVYEPEIAKLLNTFKKDHNEFYQKRKLFLENQKKAKVLADTIKEEIMAKKSTGGDNDEDEDGEEHSPTYARKFVGHEAEIERIRRKIAENQEQNLSKRFFEEGKKGARSVRIMTSKKSLSVVSKNKDSSLDKIQSKTSRPPDYLRSIKSSLRLKKARPEDMMMSLESSHAPVDDVYKLIVNESSKLTLKASQLEELASLNKGHEPIASTLQISKEADLLYLDSVTQKINFLEYKQNEHEKKDKEAEEAQILKIRNIQEREQKRQQILKNEKEEMQKFRERVEVMEKEIQDIKNDDLVKNLHSGRLQLNNTNPGN